MQRRIPGPNPSLIEAVKKRRLVVIVGSGLSIPAGGPTWKELLLGIASEAQGTDQDQELRGALEAIAAGRWLDAASVLEGILETEFRHSVVRQIQRRMEVDLEATPEGLRLLQRGGSTARSMEPTSTHRLLAQLKPRAIVTTNYDLLIEKAFRDIGKEVPTDSRSHDHLIQRVRSGDTFILKLHGDVNYPDDIVLAREDYSRVIFGENRFRETLKTLLIGSEPLWLGYGHNDPTLDNLLDEIKSTLGVNAGFAVAKRDPALKKRFKDVGMYTHWLQDWKDLPAFLLRLASDSGTHVRISAMLERPWLEDQAERIEEELVPRLGEFLGAAPTRLPHSRPPGIELTLPPPGAVKLDERQRAQDQELITLLRELGVRRLEGPILVTEIAPDSEARSAARWNFVDLEDLLQQLVNEANDAVDGDGCSIFLRDDDAERFVLRESTVMTPSIGQYSLDNARDVEKSRCGITTRAAHLGESRLVQDVQDDSYWSFSGRPLPKASEHCELPARELQSMIVVALKVEDARAPTGFRTIGVLRVVKRRGRDPFSKSDLERVKGLAADAEQVIVGALSIGKLLEIGCILDEDELCRKAVEILAKIVDGKGATIFLLNEDSEGPSRAPGQRLYTCRGTTGLTIDHKGASYVLPQDANTFTGHAVEKKLNVVVDDIHDDGFQGAYPIDRVPGPGKVSETYRGQDSVPTGPFMAAPLFFREQFDPETPAMGVIRVTKPSGSLPFSPGEQRRFFAFADKLSKTIRQVRYIALLNALSLEENLQGAFARVAREAPRLVGGKGCSVFAGQGDLEMKATCGLLEKKFAEGKLKPYCRQGDHRGYTGAAAGLARKIVWNDEDERLELRIKEGIRGSGRHECEVGEPTPARFLAVPILVGGRALGVIRVPKTGAEGPFSEDDQRMLESIASHLGRLIAAGNVS